MLRAAIVSFLCLTLTGCGGTTSGWMTLGGSSLFEELETTGLQLRAEIPAATLVDVPQTGQAEFAGIATVALVGASVRHIGRFGAEIDFADKTLTATADRFFAVSTDPNIDGQSVAGSLQFSLDAMQTSAVDLNVQGMLDGQTISGNGSGFFADDGVGETFFFGAGVVQADATANGTVLFDARATD